jgi:hypothetical protein
MRNIAKFTKAKITGVTLNEYQVQRGNELNKAAGLEATCLSVKVSSLSHIICLFRSQVYPLNFRRRILWNYLTQKTVLMAYMQLKLLVMHQSVRVCTAKFSEFLSQEK